MEFARMAKPQTVQMTDLFYFIGDSQITVSYHYKEGIKVLMMQPHSDEKTAWDAALSVLGESGGLLAHISKVDGKSHTDRNVTIKVGKKSVWFNPNHMFSDTGLRKDLDQQNLDADTYNRALKEIRKFCTDVLDKCWTYFKPEWVLAVHNDYRGFSAYKHLGRETYSNKKNDEKNFYFITQKADFDRLKELDYNAILQLEDPVDDGSASVYFKDMHYINTEVGHEKGKVKDQIDMIKKALGIN